MGLIERMGRQPPPKPKKERKPMPTPEERAERRAKKGPWWASPPEPVNVTNFGDLALGLKKVLRGGPDAVGTLRLREAELVWLLGALDAMEARQSDAELRRIVRRELAVALDLLRGG